jgi:hypothetical protein
MESASADGVMLDGLGVNAIGGSRLQGQWREAWYFVLPVVHFFGLLDQLLLPVHYGASLPMRAVGLPPPHATPPPSPPTPSFFSSLLAPRPKKVSLS